MPCFSWNRRRLAGVLVASACAALGAPAAASAADTPIADDGAATALTTAASTAECSAPTLLQPFSSWKDRRNYVLAPGGDFDGGAAGWQLGRGASIVDDVEPDGAVDGVLQLSSGAVAVSPTMCVDLDYPTARAWVRTVSGDGDVSVSVMYDAGKTARVPHVVGHVHGNKAGDWSLSSDVKIQPQLAGKEAGWRRVAFVLTGGGKAGTFRVNDFYVDPRMVR